MIKDTLRLNMRKNRRAMTHDEVSEKSAGITRALFSVEQISSAKSVCIYMSAFNEPDTSGIISRLLLEGKAVTVPVTDPESSALSLSYIDGLTEMKRSAFGIYEPSVIRPAQPPAMDVFIIPGLAFDITGNRLGFGKGCYDRLLGECDAYKIGLCYDFQLFPAIPCEEHDIKMDLIITERSVTSI